MHWRKMFPALMVAVALTLATCGIAFAEETVAVAEQIAALDAKYAAATQYIWVMVAAALVMFMQAGFAMVEAGFCRAKNATNLMAKNLMDFVMGSLVFFAVGYALLKGTDVGGIFGSGPLFLTGEFASARTPSWTSSGSSSSARRRRRSSPAPSPSA